MKEAETHYGTTIFGGLIDLVAQSLGGPSAGPVRPALAVATGAGCVHETAGRTTVAPEPAKRPGLLGRIGERLWRRQLRSVNLQVARSDDIFANLDRWLWKQHMRETEAWLAESTDIFDLEARIRHLERSRDGHIF